MNFDPMLTQTTKSIFDEMRMTATTLLNGESNPLMQAVVLRTEQGLYSASNLATDQDVDNLVSRLKFDFDEKVDYVCCIFNGGCVDLPSCAFRMALLTLNPLNAHAQIFVLKTCGISTMTIADSIK